MTKQLTVSEDLKELAKKVIEKYQSILALGNAKIDYILVEPNISKRIAGKCIKTNTELKYYSNADYIIEMSYDLWNGLNDDIKEILMLHEIMHIDCVIDDKNGDYKYNIRDHNVKDFSYIVKNFGINWIDTIKTTMASIHDVSELELGEISI